MHHQLSTHRYHNAISLWLSVVLFDDTMHLLLLKLEYFCVLNKKALSIDRQLTYFFLTLLSRWYLNMSKPQGRRENLKLLVQNLKAKDRKKQANFCLLI